MREDERDDDRSDRPGRRRVASGVALTVIAVAVGGLLAFGRPHDDQPETVRMAAANQTAETPPPGPDEETSGAPALGETPVDMTADAWASVQAEVAGDPHSLLCVEPDGTVAVASFLPVPDEDGNPTALADDWLPPSAPAGTECLTGPEVLTANPDLQPQTESGE